MNKLLALLTGLALAACAAGPPAPLGPQPTDPVGMRLSAPELQNMVVGSTGTGTRTGTMSMWSMYVSPDGRLFGKSATLRDTGTWRITPDGQLCMQWQVDFDAQPTCVTAYRMGNAIQLATSDARAVLTFLPGNKL